VRGRRGVAPKFMKSAANRIATSSQSTPGAEGYVYDGADGTQMAFWTCHETAISAPHVHDFDEYMVVVQGCYTLLFGETVLPSEPVKNISSPEGLATAARAWLARERSTPSADGWHNGLTIKLRGKPTKRGIQVPRRRMHLAAKSDRRFRL